MEREGHSCTKEYNLDGGWPGDGIRRSHTQECTHVPPLGFTAQSPRVGWSTQKWLLLGTRAGLGSLALQGHSWNLKLFHESQGCAQETHHSCLCWEGGTCAGLGPAGSMASVNSEAGGGCQRSPKTSGTAEIELEGKKHC